jgi:P-type conjugative transfer protein TrbJ
MRPRLPALLVPLLAGLVPVLDASPARAQLTVFDPANYRQNALTSLRALEQIGNQVRQLQNEARMLQRLEQNLQRLRTTIAPDVQRGLVAVQGELNRSEGIALGLKATETGYPQLFPRQNSALSSNDALHNAEKRWEEEYAGAKRAALVQAALAEGIDADRQLLGDVMARSRQAGGALEAAQAGNELAGLSVKQALALAALLAAQHRSETLARARDLATEAEARQRFKAFLGRGSAYAAGR